MGEDVLGSPLEVVDSERWVTSSRRCDIVHREPVTDSYIITELQFGEVDHDHMGRILEYMREYHEPVDFGIIAAESWPETRVNIITEDVTKDIVPVEIQEDGSWVVPTDDMGLPFNTATDEWRAVRDRLEEIEENKRESWWENIQEEVDTRIDEDLTWGSSGDRMWFYSDEPVTGGEGDVKIERRGDNIWVRMAMMYKEDKSEIEQKMRELEGKWSDADLMHRDEIGKHQGTGLWIIIDEWEEWVLKSDEIVETAVQTHRKLH